MILPGQAYLSEQMLVADPAAIHAEREGLKAWLGEALESDLVALQERASAVPFSLDAEARGARKLKENGIPALILPPVYFSVADFGADFAGTLSVPADTAHGLLRDVCVAASKRFRCVALAKIHLEPAHVRDQMRQ